MSCPVFAPQSRPCGEHGDCLNTTSTSFCVCHSADYSPFGDFSLSPANPCDIHVPAIQALWSLVICTTVIAAFTAAWGILARRRGGLTQWRAWRLWSVPYFLLAHTSMLLATCVLKITQTTNFILGGSVSMTLMHATSVMLAVTCVALGMGGISHLTGEADIRNKRQGGLAARRVFRMDLAITASWLCSLVFALMPALSLGGTGNESMVWIGSGLHGGWFATLFFFWSQLAAPHLLDGLIAQIDVSTQSTVVKRSSLGVRKIDRVLVKLRVAKYFFRTLLPPLSLGIILVAVWPFLVVKTAYFLPMMWIALELVLVGVVWVTTTTSEQTLGDLRRASIKVVSRLRTAGRNSIGYMDPLVLMSASGSPPREMSEPGVVVTSRRQSSSQQQPQ